MRILLATDAWHPQVNGVVRTLETTVRMMREAGHTIEVIQPGEFAGFPLPMYPEIKLCAVPRRAIAQRFHTFRPDSVHISTEGPIGLAVRAFCRSMRFRFTTSYHTKFPEYLQRMYHIPTRFGNRFMRWFHNGAATVMTATPTLEAELRTKGIRSKISRWSRGVDLTRFRPNRPRTWDFPRPIMLYAGRVSSEKSIEDFLRVDLPGTKVIVGDGPIRSRLERDYPLAKFLGYRTGDALAECYGQADVFVFPSRTDTFGLVVIEALASGVPVAAYPVPGPQDILTQAKCGCLSEDLAHAIRTALTTSDAIACRTLAEEYTWERCTEQFRSNLVMLR